ncbi:MAG: tetratricopeptide repeat protein [Planctomycetota bacterium]
MGLAPLRAILLFTLLATRPETTAIQRLVDRLGSASWAEREAAAAELLTYGQRAVPLLEEALDSDDPEVRHRAARLLERLAMPVPTGLSEELRRAFEYFSALPQDQRATLLARAASELGEEADSLLRRALRRDPSEAVRQQALDRLRRLNPEAATAQLRALAADPEAGPWALEQLGHELHRHGDAAGAMDAYQRAVDAGSTEPRVVTTLARLYMRRRRWAKARDLFLRLLADDPGNLDHLRQLGQCYYRLAEEARAEAVWNKMVEAQRGTPQAYLTLARAYHGIGDQERELKALRQGCQRHPEDYELLRQFARALTRERRFDEAVAVLERALEDLDADHQRRAVSMELARVLQMSGQFARYVRDREETLGALDREIAELLGRLADRRLADGDRAGARAALERIAALFPDSPAARQARQRLERLEDAP